MTTDMINLPEAHHEREFVKMADMIYSLHKDVKTVLIAGPSSSGKTSTSKRLALQCRTIGLNPKTIELDNYFVDREKTPLDENGEYDFEALGAMDLEFLGDQINDLLEGKEVEIPRFSFAEGKRYYTGDRMQLHENDILIMEGIHALNPAMLPDIDITRIFHIYAMAQPSDIRLLRRIIRDTRTRGQSPERTILRWESVQKGESLNIIPYQKYAEVVFNSTLDYEMPVLKYYAEPLLNRIGPSSPAFSEASRLLDILDKVQVLSADKLSEIPPTSILREFIGGQTL